MGLVRLEQGLPAKDPPELPKLRVTGSNPASRSKETQTPRRISRFDKRFTSFSDLDLEHTEF